MVPFINPPIYPGLTNPDVSPIWYTTSSCFLSGLGPSGFGYDEKPFPFATNIFLPITFMLVGYQPTGINPFDLLLPGTETSNTARQLLSAFATYNFFSSAESASPFEVEPSGASGNKAAFRTSTTFRFLVSITDTLLSFALATYKMLPVLFSNISLGLSPVAILSTSFFCFVSYTSTWSPPH